MKIRQRQEFLEESNSEESDALLQSSRRIDWRFLLPDITFRDIVYIGNPNSMLVDSLRSFSDSLTIVRNLGVEEIKNRGFDIAVVTEPSIDRLQVAANLIKASGMVYVEGTGSIDLMNVSKRGKNKGVNSSGRSFFFTDQLKALKKLGFNDVHAYWHWPDFDNCKRIIPLDSDIALVYAIFKGSNSYKGKLRVVIGGLLLKGGLIKLLVTRYSVVARRATI
jgi:hypothetical protein